MKFSTVVACCCGLSSIFAASVGAFAQVVPSYNIGDAVRQADETRRNAPVPQSSAAPVLPRLVDPPFTLKDKTKLLVRSFKIEGENLASETELREIVAPYEGRKLTLTEIYEVADKITTLYRIKGYLVAKAYVPAQDARKGVLRIKVVPGKYGSITVNNESLVRNDYVQGVVDHALAGSPYIHSDALERAMLLTSDLPGAGMPRVAIGSGKQPETADFAFGVPEGRRFDGYLLGDNYGSPYTGRNRLSGGVNVNSPLGYGDRLSAFGIVSEDSGLVNGRVAYSAPIGYDGLRAEVGAYRTTYALGGIYDGLDATGTADALTATLSYPIKRLREESIFVSGNFTYKSLNDNILGASISNRKMSVGTVALNRTTNGAFAGLPFVTNAMVSISAGNVNFPDPAQRAINIAGPDTVGDFSKVNASFDATVAFSEVWSLTTTFRGQKSLSGNLDSSEQFGLTGAWGVRSYDEGLSGDTGFLLTPELKYALPGLNGFRHSIGVFTDVGAAWIENAAYTKTQAAYTQLNDVGLGYYATYEYSPARFLLLKAQVAHSYGSSYLGSQSYDRGTKGLVQVGLTF